MASEHINGALGDRIILGPSQVAEGPCGPQAAGESSRAACPGSATYLEESGMLDAAAAAATAENDGAPPCSKPAKSPRRRHTGRASCAGHHPPPPDGEPTTSSLEGAAAASSTGKAAAGGQCGHDGAAASDSELESETEFEAEVEDPEEVARVRSRGAGSMGCRHYRRRCKMVAPCCGEVFWCRHCHNEEKNNNEKDPSKRHDLDRTAVLELVCALCGLQQPTAEHCSGCGCAFGAYACLQCCFFDDDLTKQQFHCDECGICRVGGRQHFFHCATCGCCYSTSLRDNHICVENSMRQNCPVCFEYLFDSVRPTAVLPCGHTIHSDCLQEMERNRQLACPICMKSYANLSMLWRRIDEEIASSPMPSEYASWQVEILCNDCNQTGRVPFHILGLKCTHCDSYNTRRIAIQRQ